MEKDEIKSLLKSLLICLIIGVSIFLISLIFLIFFDSISWSIGIAIGLGASLLNVLLLYVGAHYISKSKNKALFILFYFARMIIVLGAVLICILLGFGPFGMVIVPEFKYSLFGLLVVFAPLQIVVSVVEAKSRKE